MTLDAILLASSEAATEIPVVHPAAAEGVFSWLWLIIALPLAGALVLLLGGGDQSVPPRDDSGTAGR